MGRLKGYLKIESSLHFNQQSAGCFQVAPNYTIKDS